MVYVGAMRKSEELARRWMPGLRQGSSRPAWAHPQDLVQLLGELRVAFATHEEDVLFSELEQDSFESLEDIAWAHDLLEDGRKEDGTLVVAEDLLREGLPVEIVKIVGFLSHNEGAEEKVTYLARLKTVLDAKGSIVKLVDRICNLREGRAVFKDRRWARYVRETKDFILPLLDQVAQPEKGWLEDRLLEALAARPVVEV